MNPKLSTKILVAGVALVAAASYFPGAFAQGTSAFGGQVKAGDGDLTYVLTDAATFIAICFVDDDGSGDYNPGEAVYATASAGGCGDDVTGNDLRITPSSGQAAGSQVRATHNDFGNPYDDPGATVEFYDVDGDGVYSGGDNVYLDMDGGADEVGVGDVRLTPVGSFAAGSVVAAGNSDVNNAFEGGNPAEFAVTAWDFFDADGDGAWTNGDVAYIDGENDDDYVSAIDIRLGTIAGEPFGSQVAVGDNDLTYTLDDAGDLATICFVDDDGSGDYNPGEAVYATQTACTDPTTTDLEGNDLRINPSSGQAAGSQVRATHNDFGNPVTLLALSCVDFYDVDGDSLYSRGDNVYINIDCVDEEVSVGDIRLTPVGSFAAGTNVAAGNSDVNNGMCVAPATCAAPDGITGAAGGVDPAGWDFFDADGDDDWTNSDVAYIDADDDDLASSIDVRLGSVGGEPFGSQVTIGDNDIVYGLADVLPFTAICFVDDDGSGDYNPGEAVYATTDACGGDVTGNDLRLTPSSGQGAGTQVRATHNDFGNPYDDPGASVEFYDVDGDGVYSLGDQVYIDMDGGGDEVGVGDVRLTTVGSFAAGSVVAAGNSDVNNGFAGVAFNEAVTDWDIFDADGDGAWTNGDIAYIDADDSISVTVIDIRLGATAPTVNPPPGECPSGQTLVNGVCTTTPPGEECPTGETMVDGVCTPEEGPTGIEAQLAQLLQQNAQLSSQLNTSLSQNANLQQQLSALNTQLSNQTAQLTQLNGQISTLQAENTKLQNELAQKNAAPKTPGFEALAALAAIGGVVLVLGRRKA
jgi:hypothetical protein